MGKNQHSKDRMFITATEWKEVFGGKKAGSQAHKEFKQLSFDCCALTFQPFENPVCTKQGIVYDLLSIVPYIKKHGIDPASGEKLAIKDLVRLTFHKNKEGQYHCPVTFKVFSKHTHITAVKTSGNVYARDAIEQFNIKAKHWHDLMTDEPFKRSDLIDIQDPSHPEKNNFAAFHHIKNEVRDAASSKEKTSELKGSQYSTSSVMVRDLFTSPYVELSCTSLQRELEATEGDWKQGPALHSSTDFTKDLVDAEDSEHAAHYSTGEVSASFTSTHLGIRTTNRAASLADKVVRYAAIQDNGYVRIKTSLGELNVELFCKWVPLTCENFLKHCRAGYYNKTLFHRSIKHFMVQGGDPTGTGTGGESAFEGGKAFKNEITGHLSHKGRGILSMANSGKDTNKSQFFITYRSCTHLDGKHTIFGRVVGGMDTLADIERVETDDKDKPKETIKILETLIFTDPFADYDALKAQGKAPKPVIEAAEEDDEPKLPKQHRKGVGQFIAPSAIKQAKRGAVAAATEGDEAVSKKYQQLAAKKSKQGKAAGGYGNFGGW